MENTTVFLGIISCFLFATLTDCSTVTAPADKEVMATPNIVTNPSQMVNITLNCTGSEKGLSYYVKNRITWSFTSFNGKTMKLIDSFQLTPEAEAENTKYPNKYGLEFFDSEPKFVLQLTVTGVKARDDGVYTCSLFDLDNTFKSRDEVAITVVNRVERVTLEIHEIDDKHTVLKSKTVPVAANDAPLKLTPGTYMIKCIATGSNPAPVMEVFYNMEKPYVNIISKKNTDGNRVKYTGTVEIKQMELMASGAEQIVVCRANVPKRQFPSREAGIKLMVLVEKPIVMCSEALFRNGDRYQEVKCNLTTPQGGAGLMCDQVFWTFDDAQNRTKIGDTGTDLHTICDTVEYGLETTLTVVQLKQSHFETIFYLEYGTGKDGHKYPVQFEMRGTAGSSAVTSFSLLACIAMAIMTRLASKHL